jgi:hypothetical protein
MSSAKTTSTTSPSCSNTLSSLSSGVAMGPHFGAEMFAVECHGFAASCHLGGTSQGIKHRSSTSFAKVFARDASGALIDANTSKLHQMRLI